MSAWFEQLAHRTSRLVGAYQTFVGACLIVVVWLITGPLFNFSDTWQLLINTATTIATNLVVLLNQNSQNRSDDATHLKLDEIIKALGEANNQVMGAERFSEEQLTQLLNAYVRLSDQERAQRGDNGPTSLGNADPTDRGGRRPPAPDLGEQHGQDPLGGVHKRAR